MIMNLFLLLRPCQQFYGNSMALRALLFSTQALTRQPSAFTPLKHKIMRAGDPRASVVPVLEKWVQQGNEIKHSQFRKLTGNLRRAHRFNHALQILQWMADKGGYEMSAADFGLQLELISRVHGIEQVEMYFDAIPYNLRGCEAYCALLNSYAYYYCIEKAEATMEKMRELGFLRSAAPYNAMISIYGRGYGSSVIYLEAEMREEGINRNRLTYIMLARTYVSYPGLIIPLMETHLKELEADPLVKMDWYLYLLAARVYWKGRGDIQKTWEMLWKAEESMGENLSRFGFELLTLYAAVGNKDDVDRLWSLHKLNKRFYNKAYLCMIKSLTKLDNIDGAERIWEEWFSKKKVMDVRIPEAMVYAYYRVGKWEKAEAIVLRMAESGIEPNAGTFYSLGKAYVKADQMDKAVEASMKMLSLTKPGTIVSLYSIHFCFQYLARQGDDVAMDELYRLMKEHCGVLVWECDDLRYPWVGATQFEKRRLLDLNITRV